MIDDYRKALKAGRRQVGAAIAEGRHPYLPSLEELLEGRPEALAAEVPIGVREIPLDLVVGTRTRGRSNVFSCGFLPIAGEDTEFANKWSDLYDAQMSEGIRDPVTVYEYLQRFYVQEGNKRVSVLRYLKMPTVLASVTRIRPSGEDKATLRRYQEFERLYRVAPIYGLTFSKEGSCELLAKLVGRTLDDEWPDDVVRDVEATFRQFCRSYVAHGGDELKLNSADAFLLYLQATDAAQALEESPAQIDARVGGMWKELVVSAADDGIAYVESPSERRSAPKPLRGFSRGLRSAKPMRVAFIYDRDPGRSGWVVQHERGRMELQQRLGGLVDTSAFFNRSTDRDFQRAVDAAVADESDVIVTASPRQMTQTRRAAVEHPHMLFINCSVNLTSSAVRTYYARMYEVKFLMGSLAACLAKNHRVGYVANSPIYGSVAEINAFAIGASLVDPYATVHLKWLSAEGYDWRQELADADVRVIAGQDYPDPLHPAEPYGLYCNHKDGSPEIVATPVWDWGRYYELIVRSIQDDTWRREGAAHKDRALNYWWGMSADVVRLDLSEGFANGPRRLVGMLRQALLDGTAHPFEGLLVAQGGTVVKGEEEPRLSGGQIAGMRWLNGNVVGRLPKQWELSEEGLEAVVASGVISAEIDAEEG